jgi:flavin-dependent dehydrogenase
MMRPCLGLDDAGDTVWDVIILGAGPAGTIAAHQLATSGARTLLVDKRLFPRGKVCGACLNASALEVLRSVGLDRLVGELGGIRLDGLELGFAGRSTRLDLPGGIALSRERLDAALVDVAVAAGAAFLPQTEGLVGAIQADARRVVLIQANKTITARARVVLVATGLGHIRFEGESPVKSRPTARSRVGAGCTVDDFPDFYREGTVFMTVGRNGYVGLVRVEAGRLNVAAAFNKNHVKDGGSPGAAANRILLEAGFAPAPALLDAAWRGTASLTRQTRPISGERFFVLGDATGYIEPFTGEGMAWAMVSGKAIAPLVRRGIDCWEPSLPRTWVLLHRQLVTRRQYVCRAIATLLHHPRLAHAAFELVARVPGVARLMIERVYAPSALPQPS